MTELSKTDQTPADLAAQLLADKELDQAVGGAADIFLQLGEIKGESQDDKHKG
jgi:hypothetical protein